MSVDTVLLARQVLTSAGVPNVRTRIPSPATAPLVRLEAAGGEFSRSDAPDWLVVAELQLDVWDELQGDARALTSQCRTALLAAPRSNPPHPAGVVTRVEVGEPQWIPDEDWRTGQDLPMPRFLTIVRLAAHPNPRAPGGRSMARAASETLAKSAGDVYAATVGTAAPDASVADALSDATLTGGAWSQVGWLGPDGPQLEGFGGDNTKHYGWNAVKPIRATTRVTEPMVTVPLLQWNTENLQLYFPGATYDALTETLSIPDAGSIVETALLIVVRDGTAKDVGLWLGKVSPRGNGNLTFPGDGLSEIPVAYDVLSLDDGSEPYKVLGVAPAGT